MMHFALEGTLLALCSREWKRLILAARRAILAWGYSAPLRMTVLKLVKSQTESHCATGPTRAASSARLDSSRSGFPSAEITAPIPFRADGRFTHTVESPSDCAGITS